LPESLQGGLQLDSLLRESLRFEVLSGDVTRIQRPHTTGWRTLPGLVFAQLQRGRTILRLGDGRALRVDVGEGLFVPAGVLHRSDLDTPSGTSRWVHANYFILHDLDLFSLLEVPPVIPRKLAARLGDAIEEWVESEARGGGAVLMSAGRNAFGFRLLALLSEVCRLRPGAERSLSGMVAIQPVIEHMNRNLGRLLDRDTLAEVAGLSRAQFHRVFMQATGCSPVQYLRSIRMRLAQQLLIATDEPIKAIARRCGSEDVFVFSKAFKRGCGLSPSDYRLSTRDLAARGGGLGAGLKAEG
jgi:AraC-like DNA-binding protein